MEQLLQQILDEQKEQTRLLQVIVSNSEQVIKNNDQKTLEVMASSYQKLHDQFRK